MLYPVYSYKMQRSWSVEMLHCSCSVTKDAIGLFSSVYRNQQAALQDSRKGLRLPWAVEEPCIFEALHVTTMKSFSVMLLIVRLVPSDDSEYLGGRLVAAIRHDKNNVLSLNKLLSYKIIFPNAQLIVCVFFYNNSNILHKYTAQRWGNVVKYTVMSSPLFSDR